MERNVEKEKFDVGQVRIAYAASRIEKVFDLDEDRVRWIQGDQVDLSDCDSSDDFSDLHHFHCLHLDWPISERV